MMAVALLASAPNQAFAEIATHDLNVRAGLASAVTFDCDRALSFGEAVAPQGDRGGISQFQTDGGIDGTKEGIEAVGGQPRGVAFSTDSGSHSGRCNVSGTPDTCYNARFSEGSNDGPLEFSLQPAEVGGLSPASESSDVKIKVTMYDPILLSSSPLDLGSDGQATFGVGGTITIKDNLDKDDFGGYAVTLGIDLEPWDCNSEI